MNIKFTTKQEGAYVTVKTGDSWDTEEPKYLITNEKLILKSIYTFEAASEERMFVSVIPDRGYQETKFKFEFWIECPGKFGKLSGIFAKFSESE